MENNGYSTNLGKIQELQKTNYTKIKRQDNRHSRQTYVLNDFLKTSSYLAKLMKERCKTSWIVRQKQ